MRREGRQRRGCYARAAARRCVHAIAWSHYCCCGGGSPGRRRERRRGRWQQRRRRRRQRGACEQLVHGKTNRECSRFNQRCLSQTAAVHLLAARWRRLVAPCRHHTRCLPAYATAASRWTAGGARGSSDHAGFVGNPQQPAHRGSRRRARERSRLRGRKRRWQGEAGAAAGPLSVITPVRASTVCVCAHSATSDTDVHLRAACQAQRTASQRSKEQSARYRHAAARVYGTSASRTPARYACLDRSAHAGAGVLVSRTTLQPAAR
jgi:hypothetical protein